MGCRESGMKGSAKESQCADRPAPHADTSAPPPSQGGLERQGWGGVGQKPRLLPVTALFFLCEIRPVGGANGAAESILAVAHTKTLLHLGFFTRWQLLAGWKVEPRGFK